MQKGQHSHAASYVGTQQAGGLLKGTFVPWIYEKWQLQQQVYRYPPLWQFIFWQFTFSNTIQLYLGLIHSTHVPLIQPLSKAHNCCPPYCSSWSKPNKWGTPVFLCLLIQWYKTEWSWVGIPSPGTGVGYGVRGCCQDYRLPGSDFSIPVLPPSYNPSLTMCCLKQQLLAPMHVHPYQQGTSMFCAVATCFILHM